MIEPKQQFFGLAGVDGAAVVARGAGIYDAAKGRGIKGIGGGEACILHRSHGKVSRNGPRVGQSDLMAGPPGNVLGIKELYRGVVGRINIGSTPGVVVGIRKTPGSTVVPCAAVKTGHGDRKSTR